MKITLNSADFAKALKLLVKLVPSKPAVPAYSQALLTVTDKLTVTCSNGESSLAVKIKTDTIDAAGETAVDAKLLAAYISSLPANTPVTLSANGTTVTLSWLKGSTSIPAYDPREYPRQRRTDETSQHYIADTESLGAAIDAVLPSISESDIRPVMSCLLMEMKNGELNVVGSNAHILTARVAETVSGGEKIPDSTCLVHRNTVGIARELMKEAKMIMIRHDGGTVEFINDTASLTVKQTEGRYPAWRTVIPSKAEKTTVMPRKDTMEAVSRVTATVEEKNSMVSLEVKGGEMRMKASDLQNGTSGTETLAVQGDEDIAIAFKSAFLDIVLSGFNGADVMMEFKDANHAAVFRETQKDAGGCTVLMPVLV